jgi:hypothetical protein
MINSSKMSRSPAPSSRSGGAVTPKIKMFGKASKVYLEHSWILLSGFGFLAGRLASLVPAEGQLAS